MNYTHTHKYIYENQPLRGKKAMDYIWICLSSHPICDVFHILREVGVERKVSKYNTSQP